MAGPDDSENPKAQPPPHEPKVLGRREVLKGLSTVPALGLFGYAWQRQRQYQQARAEETVAAAHAPAAGLQEINVALIGAGAQGQVLTDAMLRIPGIRFRAVCDVWTEYQGAFNPTYDLGPDTRSEQHHGRKIRKSVLFVNVEEREWTT